MNPIIEKLQNREEIHARFKGKVSGYINGKISNPYDAEDLVSAVFVKVFEGLDRFDEEKASLSTWIYTITKNTITDWFRTRRIYDPLSEQIDADDDMSGLICSGDNVEETVVGEETLELLADGLERLELRERDLIILHYYSGQTLKDIADRMGLSYSMIKVIHKNALERLRKYLRI